VVAAGAIREGRSAVVSYGARLTARVVRGSGYATLCLHALPLTTHRILTKKKAGCLAPSLFRPADAMPDDAMPSRT
jgi:hypothetical protein